jgi:hypothetical protein
MHCSYKKALKTKHNLHLFKIPIPVTHLSVAAQFLFQEKQTSFSTIYHTPVDPGKSGLVR